MTRKVFRLEIFLLFIAKSTAQYPPNPDMLQMGAGMMMKGPEMMVATGAMGASTVVKSAPGGAQAYQEMGKMQCKGADHVTGIDFVKTGAGEGVDFGGDYLCGPTCGGVCQPNQNPTSDTPFSGYAFRCNCPPDRCTYDGPVVTETTSKTVKYAFKVVCVKEGQCQCQGGNPPAQTGYLCNWININLNETSGMTDTASKVKPNVSPIRWCACCPS